jgi:hypothetical protein
VGGRVGVDTPKYKAGAIPTEAMMRGDELFSFLKMQQIKNNSHLFIFSDIISLPLMLFP